MNTTLLMPFFDESESFVNGFETGQIWEQIKNGEEIWKRPIHTSNEKQISAMCEMFGCTFCIGNTESKEWMWLSISPTEI